MKSILHVLLGIILTILVYFCYTKIILSENIRTVQKQTFLIDTITHKIQKDSNSVVAKINYEIQTEVLTINERINSINKRFDDLYIFGGIIITLLLAITLSVYIKAEAEVDKHFRDNFDKYKNQIIQNATEVEKIINEIKVKAEIIEKLRSNIIKPQSVDRGEDIEQPTN